LKGEIIMAYCAYITAITNIRKHSNADRLNVGQCFGNNVIVSLETKEGEVGVYFPVDGQLGVEYATKNNLLRLKNPDGSNSGGYLEPDKRNIKALKLRGEQSDGLFMPLKSLESFVDVNTLKVGDSITVLNGVVICEKYIPRSTNNSTVTRDQGKKKVGKAPKIVVEYPTFEEHIDTAQLAYNKHAFKAGDFCEITLKMHGTSGRTGYLPKETTRRMPRFLRFFGIGDKKNRDYDYVTGTRRVVLKNYNNGFYGDDSFREKYHNAFKGKLHKGETAYYEIVGYVNDSTPIMGRCSNAKLNDKNFVKMYGPTTTFSYGCEAGQNEMYIYRMTMTNDDGDVVEYPYSLIKSRADQMGMKVVPLLDQFFYTNEEDLMARVETLCDGPDPVGLTHVREGVVVRIENREKFSAYKNKGFNFKVLEGLIKETATAPDMEEAQEV